LTEENSDLKSDCKRTHFEYVYIAIPNLLTRLSIEIDQTEIKYSEEQILKKPDNEELLNKLRKSEKTLKILPRACKADMANENCPHGYCLFTILASAKS